MNKYEMVAMIATVVTIGATVSTIARALILRMGMAPKAPARASLQDEERLERIERAVEAVAIEVERISEAQRYTLALLSERTPAGQLEQGGALGPQFPPSRVNTPH